MTKFLTFAFFSIATTTASVGAASLPPASGNDGILVAPSATNPNLSLWTSSALWNYRISSDNTLVVPTATGFDSFGKKWSDQAPKKDDLDINGGVLRTVFLGASSGWLDALGYTFSANPLGEDSFTLASAAAPTTPLPPSSLTFGDSVLFPFAAGEAASFDLWFGGSNGLRGLFSSANSADLGPLAVTWTQAALLVPTLPLSELGGTPIETPTWIASISDGTNSFRFALQSSNLASAAFEPVPEPATYGYCAMLGLLGLVVLRRRRESQK